MQRRLLALLGIAVLVVTACGSDTVSPSPTSPAAGPSAATTDTPPAQEGGSLSFTRFADFAPIFHTVGTQGNQYMLNYLIYDTLVTLDLSDPSLQTLKPRLAESWEVSADATTFTFHLRHDVNWQDGTPFTADDVVYTATWAAENKNGFKGFQPVWFALKDQAAVEKACTDAGGDDPAKCGGTEAFAGVKKIDDYTVQFVLAAPDVFFLSQQAAAINVILPKHLLAGQTLSQIETSDFTNKAPVGTGPFKLDQIVPDQFVSFNANPDYWGGKPKLDKIIYKSISTDTALAQLQSGEMDVAFDVGAGNFDQLSTVPLLNVKAVPSPGEVAINVKAATNAQYKEWNSQFGINLPPLHVDLSDPRVRQAMYYAIDRRSINDQLYGGLNTILWVEAGLNPDYPGLDQYPYDPVKAKSLLDAAIADGKFDASKNIRFMYTQGAAEQIAPIVQQQLEAVGFNIDLQFLDQDSYNALTVTIDADKWASYDMTLGDGNGSGNAGLGPEYSQIYYRCGDEQPLGTSEGYYNCDIRALYLKARTTVDSAERDKLYEQIAQILNSDVPNLWLWRASGIQAVNKRVQGLVTPTWSRFATIDAANWSVTQ